MTKQEAIWFIKTCKRHGIVSAAWGDLNVTFGAIPQKRAGSKKETYKPTQAELELQKQTELDELMIENPMEWEKQMKGMR
jgi:hypothetical protein